MMRKKIVYVINDLAVGGAEIMLVKLIKHLDYHLFDITVVCLQAPDKLSDELEKLAIKITYLYIHQPYQLLTGVLKLTRVLKEIKPDVVQTWMYHSDFIGGLAAKLAGVPNIIWTVRNNKLAPERSKKTTRWLAKLLAKLSYWIPNKIICCASDVAKTHVAIGYDAKKIQIIYNGFELDRYKKDVELEKIFKEKQTKMQNKFCIGWLGRYHPDKGIDIFLSAAKIIAQTDANILFVCGGAGIEQKNTSLMNQIKSLGLEAQVLLLGPVEDGPAFYNAIDVFVLSSLSEGFPNVVGEAMACETPCVVTDVGDAAYLLGMKMLVIPVNAPEILASSILRIKKNFDDDDLAAQHTGQQLRARIKQHFSISQIVQQYQRSYMD